MRKLGLMIENQHSYIYRMIEMTDKAKKGANPQIATYSPTFLSFVCDTSDHNDLMVYSLKLNFSLRFILVASLTVLDAIIQLQLENMNMKAHQSSRTSMHYFYI